MLPCRSPKRPRWYSRPMAAGAWLLLHLLLSSAIATAGSLEGFVRAKGEAEGPAYAYIALTPLAAGDSAGAARTGLRSVSNPSGFYSFGGVTPGAYRRTCRAAGYRDFADTVSIGESTLRRDIVLATSPFPVSAVDVRGEREPRDVRGTPSYVELPARELKRLPAVGEADLIRSLQLLPGVQAASDFSSGLYIRGGGPDQTLILLDQIPLYNPTHAFGFFSTFNPGAIKDVALYKGAYPSQYGGRLGSVLDVENRDGSRDGLRGTGAVSLIAGRATVEGPIRNGSWILSARRTYLEPVLNAVRNDSTEIPSYFFYDLNGRVHRSMSPRDDLSFSGYRGRDKLHLDLDRGTFVDIRWGNVAGMGRWMHDFGRGAIGNLIVSATEYRSDTDVKIFSTPLFFGNRLLDVSAKGDLSWNAAPGHAARAGVSVSAYRFELGQQFNGVEQPGFDERPVGTAAFVEDQWTPNVLSTVRPGVRAEVFGPRGHVSVEPRLSVNHVLGPNVRVKAGGGGYTQHLQLVSTEAFNGTDFWVPTDGSAKPGRSWQAVSGLEWLPTDTYTISVEGYYTWLRNLVQLDNTRSADAQGTSTEDLFHTGGRGWASGVELFAQKRRGALTGWVGYTLGWSRRRWPELNEGQTFPPKYDRRHDVKVVAQWNRKRWSFGSDFVFATGQAFTPLEAQYALSDPATGQDKVLLLPGTRNSARLLPYHRLDLSATLHGHLFGVAADYYVQVFNVYNRKNEWFVQYDTEQGVAPEPKIVHQLPLIPTIGINFDL
jgi:TonB-dependent Receptor Plug Domain